MRSLLLLFISTLPLSTIAAQEASAVSPLLGSTTKPGMFWGTVITRSQFSPLTGEQRWGLYWRQAYWTPGVYFRATGIAALDQNKNVPAEWGQGFSGYMKRVGNEFGRAALQDSLEAAGAAALQQDVRYVKCECKGVLKRTAYAIGANFVTLNKKGRWEPAYARLGATVGAEYIANAWMPPGYRNWNTSLRDAGLQFAFGSAFNIIREFVPMKKK